jgi:predicted secreted Zn-dependent protease
MLVYSASGSRLWWNWQTRYFEVVVGQPVQVQVLLSAPKLPELHSLVNSLFIWFRRAVLVFLFTFTLSAHAQIVHWTTNYYSVTGANFREIRQSIAASRPWKDSFDGDTRWNITWNFTLARNANGCSCSSFRTTTKITTTMPRWTPPPNVAPEIKEYWTRYYTNLLQHEAGHARIGLAAAAEIRQRLGEIGTQLNCDEVKRIINQRANNVVDDYRNREKEYDRRTNHGNSPSGSP